MEIRELNIQSFGKFHNKTMTFTSGINIVSGRNEAGKTTLYHFLKGMLFGIRKNPDKNKDDIYAQYVPWNNPMEYSGELKFELNGKIFKVSRVFRDENRMAELVCETTGETLSVEAGDLTRLLGGITESGYQNTMSIGQLSVETDENLASALRNYAAKYCGAGSSSINVINAYRKLTQRFQDCDDEIKVIEKEQKDKVGQVIKKIDSLNDKQERTVQEIRDRKEEAEGMVTQKNEMSLRCDELENKKDELKHKKDELWDDLTQTREDEVRIEERIIRSKDKQSFRSKEYEDAMQEWSSVKITQKVFDSILILIGALGVGSGLYFNLVKNIELGFSLVLILIGLVCLFFGTFKVLKWNRNKKPDEPEIDSDEMGKLETIQDMIVNKRKEASEQLEQITKELEETEIELLKLHNGIDEIGNQSNKIYGKVGNMEDQLSEIKVEISNLQEEQEEFGKVSPREIELIQTRNAITMAKERLDWLAEALSEQFSLDLQRRASQILSELTRGKYTRLVIDDALNMHLNTTDRVIPIEKVSRGTIDQIYFALRMSVLETMYKDELPVIMDDAMAFYDDDRMAEALFWLASNKKQVILFTCHRREEDFLRENNIDYNRCLLI